NQRINVASSHPSQTPPPVPPPPTPEERRRARVLGGGGGGGGGGGLPADEALTIVKKSSPPPKGKEPSQPVVSAGAGAGPRIERRKEDEPPDSYVDELPTQIFRPPSGPPSPRSIPPGTPGIPGVEPPSEQTRWDGRRADLIEAAAR